MVTSAVDRIASRASMPPTNPTISAQSDDSVCPGGGYVIPLGCCLVSGWRDGGNSESGVGTWWAEVLLYGLKVMTDWRWMHELVRGSEMVEMHVC